ncbi:YppG family protein [Pontibacillus litoralis]|uniref:YppG family protein n=1 Tax=Pontibacillus litoralis TaxID=516703 RepID=UPI000690C8D2|nr:YppG family protein [Pontibacillus litoralis]
MYRMPKRPMNAGPYYVPQPPPTIPHPHYATNQVVGYGAQSPYMFASTSFIPQEETPQLPAFKTPYEQFAKPPQPKEWSSQQWVPQNGQQNAQQTKGIMTYFMDKNGQLDLDKMLSTMGQVANTANQISPLVKGISTFMKGI